MHTGWKVTLAGFTINVLVGITYTWSIFARGLVDELGWSHAQAAAPFSAFLLCYAFAMVPAGRLQDRIGPRPVVSLGALLAGLGFALCALLLTPAGVALLWGGLVGPGMACCFAAVTPAAVRWFPVERRGSVAGIVVTGVGISAFILAPLVNALVNGGTRYAFLACAILLFAGIIIPAQFISVPSHRPPAQSPTHRLGAVFRSALFYRFWVMFFLTTAAGVTVVSHLITLARVHAGAERAYFSVSLFALCSAAGRIVAGYLSDRIGRRRAMSGVFAAILVALSGLYAARTPAVLGASVALIGLAYGGLFTVFPTATAAYFGENDFGLKYGVVFSAIGFAGVGPWFAGVLFERYGTFHPALMVLAIMCSVAIALAVTLPSRPSAA